ncbi:MAG: hypothetical protein KQH79_07040 [Bacteroidetes bacterium]|nr:hypothetical protein [Bacteroidota bacterium]
MIELIGVSLFILILNIPFGYWRANVKLLSLQWYLAVHIPVPFIILLRILTDVGFGWQTYIYLVLAFFIGQRIGSLFRSQLKKHMEVSSCLFMDLFKLRKINEH